MTIRKTLSILFALVMLLFCLCGCSSKPAETAGAEKLTYQDYLTARVGVATGTYPSTLFPKMFPDAELSEFNTVPDMIMALSLNKIDICATDLSYYTAMRWEGMELGRLEDPVVSSDYGMIFKKNSHPELQSQINAFIAQYKTDGRYQSLLDKWLGDTEPTEFLDYTTLDGKNGTLKVITAVEAKPFSYLKNNSLVGFDIEFLTMFAKEYGYQLDFTAVSFQSVLVGISQGMYDIGTAGITITAERAESVDFSDVYHVEDIVYIIQSSSAEKDSFVDYLRSGFDKTFIRESRWKLIVQGVATTLLISVLSVLFGTALGFLLYLGVRAQSKALSRIAKAFVSIYSKLIAGVPSLVILMVLFYVVFSKSDIGGTPVAVIGFTLIFGSFVCSQLSLSVEGVDKGQTEAAYALGYSRDHTFMRIILPQAMRTFLPVYSAEIVSLIKSTSVVGYIAVNDLTKMGDIIRSNTFEAIFPLASVSLIYFLIIWFISVLMDVLKRKAEPRLRKNQDILKGVVR